MVLIVWGGTADPLVVGGERAVPAAVKEPDGLADQDGVGVEGHRLVKLRAAGEQQLVPARRADAVILVGDGPAAQQQPDGPQHPSARRTP